MIVVYIPINERNGTTIVGHHRHAVEKHVVFVNGSPRLYGERWQYGHASRILASRSSHLAPDVPLHFC